MIAPSYHLAMLADPPPLQSPWDAWPWNTLPTATLGYVVPRSTAHRPRVLARVACDADGLTVRFRLEDRYIRSVVTTVNGPVCTDSCVELFLQPGTGGYFNMEVNAGGTMLMYYIEDATPLPGVGFARFTPVADTDIAQIDCVTSLPSVVEPEIHTPVTWEAGWRVPFTLLERYAGPIQYTSGMTWRGNFYKCADQTSHPHWLSWAPITGESFHQPSAFGTFQLSVPSPA